ncbi:aspartyl-phosphate phosphatase Spo0E family protein [Neobacillus sp. PS3-34]|uniref:aspartyl-phosphate phosphatase Spo0E family protein n=1 Tax=Neobacillus sp. PS3-34 TaxID=3070678 RepID=UPI0027DF2B46|nr:aspartyl-phosphate phosphatase Spo0E family protein [Neobacillus sp. PS3-34]WML50584.1 aspartyl-phosphate phosphatase Spo0E family protein [Neobacillus sp. PS3-34]
MIDIEKCRTEMVRLATHTSLSDKHVIETSTRLDSLLNKYYLLTNKKNSYINS